MADIGKEELQELKDTYGEATANLLKQGTVDDDEKKDFVDAVTGGSEELFDIDMALDTYDSSFPGYTPSEHALEFFNLMRLVQGGDFEFNTPIAHYFMADLLLNEITDVNMFPFSEEVCAQIVINHLRLSFCCS